MTPPVLSLTGQKVFITGGATGIGAELVRQFASLGAEVAFNDINADAGGQLAEDIASVGQRKPHFLVCDASQGKLLMQNVDEAAARLGGLTVLVNNVANDLRDTVDSLSPESWEKSLSVNLNPAAFASRAALPHLRKAGGGSIINFSSLNALIGPADLIAYTTAKAGIIGLTKSLARAMGEDRIRVNAIIPGWVVTEKQKRLWLTPQAEADWKAQCALKDDLLPADIAHLTVFLASPLSRMITGQGFVIDAGRT